MSTQRGLKWALAGVVACVATGTVADSRASSSHLDYARVVDVAPIIRPVRVETPLRTCWSETEYRLMRRESVHYGASGGRVDTAAPTIAGGLVGGLIGRQFGAGSGRDAMTAVGALVGAAMANQGALNRTDTGRHVTHERRPVVVERCRTTVSYRDEPRVEGYRVTYVYAGREYRTHTVAHPGDRIPVRVTFSQAVERK